jgi:hypothetical protein
MEKITLDQDASVELRIYSASLDAYLLGVKAGVAAARHLRMEQIVKAHLAKQPPPEPQS